MLLDQLKTIDDGLIFAVRLDGAGGAVPVRWEDLEGPDADLSGIWCHLEFRSERARGFLDDARMISDTQQDALLAPEARPRAVRGPCARWTSTKMRSPARRRMQSGTR